MSSPDNVENFISFFQARKPELGAEEILDSLWLLDCIAKYEASSEQTELNNDNPDTFTIHTNSKGIVEPDDTEEELSSSLEPTVEVHLPSPRPAIPGSSGSSGLDYRSKAAATLPQALLLDRALRLFKYAIKSRRYSMLDVEATIKHIADTDQKFWFPQLKPEMEKWLEAAVVIDVNSTMLLWQEPTHQFSRLLERNGNFRKVSFWGLGVDEEGIYLQSKNNKQSYRQRKSALGATDGKQLIFLISDCLSPAWRNELMGQFLKDWQEEHLIVLIQMLPDWLWEYTALGNTQKVFLSARERLLSNRRLQPNFLPGFPASYALKLPVISLSSEGLTNWARVVQGDSRVEVNGFWLLFSATQNPNERTNKDASNFTTEEKIEQFRRSASYLARELAVLLSGLPLNLQIVRLACRMLLPEAGIEHIAEVFLSGLVERNPGQSEDTSAEKLEFEFVPRAREILQKSLRNSDISRLIGHFLEGRGDYGGGFPAVILTPELAGNSVISPASLPFARIAAKLLRRFGNKYASLIPLLEGTASSLVPAIELKEGYTSASKKRITKKARETQEIALMNAFIALQAKQFPGAKKLLEKLDPELLAPELLPRYYAIAGELEVELKDYEQALENLTRALELFQARPKTPRLELERLRNWIGLVYYYQAKYLLAIEQHRLCLKAIQEKGISDRRFILETYKNLGNNFFVVGHTYESLEYYRQAMELAEAGEDDYSLANIYWGIGLVYRSLDKLPLTKLYLDKSAATYAALGELKLATRAKGNLGMVLVERKEFSEAELVLQEGLESAKQLDDPEALYLAHVNLSFLYTEQASLDQAKEEAERAVYNARRLNDPVLIGQALARLAEVMLHMNEVEETVKLFMEAVNMIEQTEAYEYLKEVCFRAGSAFEQFGKVQEAIGMFRKAYAYQNRSHQ